MRKITIWAAVAATVLGVFATGSVSAQALSSYFMEGSTFRTQLNPALAPSNKGYLNIPALGGVQVNMTGNFGLSSILYPTADGRLVTLLDSDISTQTALSGLKDMSVLGLDTRVAILGAGWYTKNRKSFWSFDINLRTNVDMGVPKSLFRFVKEGRNHAVIEDLAFSAETYVEAGVAHSWSPTDKLYVGVRGKFLVGGARARMAVDRMEIDINRNIVSVDGHGSFDAYGVDYETQLREDGTEYYDITKPKRAERDQDGELVGGGEFPPINVPSGYGFALDLGATYDVLKNFQVSLAVNDLGAMFWNKADRRRGEMGFEEQFEGFKSGENGEIIEPEFGFDELMRFNPITLDKGETRWLRTSINAGAEYRLWNRRIGLGVLYNMQFGHAKTYHNIMAAATFTPIRWFSLGANYSFLHRGHSVGLALNICPSWINFFVATDVLFVKKTPQWIPTHGTDMNVTFGIGIPIGKKGNRNGQIKETFI